jgi:hypothetical protein
VDHHKQLPSSLSVAAFRCLRLPLSATHRNHLLQLFLILSKFFA